MRYINRKKLQEVVRRRQLRSQGRGMIIGIVLVLVLTALILAGIVIVAFGNQYAPISLPLHYR